MRLGQTILFMFILTAGAVAMANEAGGHGSAHAFDDHVKKTILWQTLNVSVMFAGLFYFLKVPVKKYFAEKKQSYIRAAERANEALKAAEQEQMAIQIRLTKLESTADESVSRARAEAADMKKQLIAEAEALSKKIREEAEQAARLEVEKAKNKLREQLIADSIQLAKNNMESKVSAEDLKRLQGDFINNIQAVQQ